jgi:hypothetical protein
MTDASVSDAAAASSSIEVLLEQHKIHLDGCRTHVLTKDIGPFKAGTKVSSVIDWIKVVFDDDNKAASDRLLDLLHRDKPVSGRLAKLQFPGARQRLTPISDAKGLMTILCKLKATTEKSRVFQDNAFDIISRVVGGDQSLHAVVDMFHAAQKQLPPDHAMKVFQPAQNRDMLCIQQRCHDRLDACDATKIASAIAKHCFPDADAKFYMQKNSLVTQGVTHRTPKQIREQFNLPSGIHARSIFGGIQLAEAVVLERKAQKRAMMGKNTQEVLVALRNDVRQMQPVTEEFKDDFALDVLTPDQARRKLKKPRLSIKNSPAAYGLFRSSGLHDQPLLDAPPQPQRAALQTRNGPSTVVNVNAGGQCIVNSA